MFCIRTYINFKINLINLVSLIDNRPTFFVPTLTVEADALAGTIDEILVNTFSPVTVSPAPLAVKTSVCDFQIDLNQ